MDYFKSIPTEIYIIKNEMLIIFNFFLNFTNYQLDLFIL